MCHIPATHVKGGLRRTVCHMAPNNRDVIPEKMLFHLLVIFSFVSIAAPFQNEAAQPAPSQKSYLQPVHIHP